MSTAYELLTGEQNAVTGTLLNPGGASFKSPAHSLGTSEITISYDTSSSYNNLNMASSLGATVYMITASFVVQTFSISTSQGITSSAHIENHEYETVTSDSNPLPLQGTNTVDWNPFPVPEQIPIDSLPQRDLSRYQKAYSFSRYSPKRIRLYRSR